MHIDILPSMKRTMGSRSTLFGPVLKRLTPEEAADAYTFLEHVEHLYPGFRLWFVKKVIPGCAEGARAIFTTEDEKSKEISGIAILKRDLHEQKICTLFVHPDHTGRGNGARLLAAGLAWLETACPIITVGEARYGAFSRLFKRNGFELTSKINGLYRSNDVEYVFNDFARIHTAPTSPGIRALPYVSIGGRRKVSATTRSHSSSADTILSGNLNWDAYS